MADRVTTARLRADVSQFLREIGKAAAAAKALDAALGGGSLSTTDKQLLEASKSAATFSREVEGASESVEGLSSDLDNVARSAESFNRELGNEAVSEWHFDIDRAAKSTAKFDDILDDSARSAAALNVSLGNDAIAPWRLELDNATRSAIRFNKAIEPLRTASSLQSAIAPSEGFGMFAMTAEDREGIAQRKEYIDSLNKEYKELLKTRVAADKMFDALSRMGNETRRNTKSVGIFGIELGSAENRMQTITQALLAIGPAAVPAIAAVGAGVVALSGTLTFAAAGAATAALAFAGIGDASKALNEAALEPSIANLEKLHAAMEKLGPAGQDFVVFLQSARGSLEQLQNVAGASFLPGLQEGMAELIAQMPMLEQIVQTVGSTLGEGLAAGGDALRDPVWQEFFSYLATDANKILSAMGGALGNFITGIASVIQAFGPLTADFATGINDMARSFAAFAAELDTSQGFQRFIGYIREITPQLLQTLEALGRAILDLAKATAPIQGPALNAIEALANALSLFLETPLAPVLLATASALGAVATAMRIGKWAGGFAIVKLLQAIAPAAAMATGAMIASSNAMLTYKRTMAFWGQYGRAVASGLAIAGLALTDWDEKVGRSNTLNLAAAGAMAGGWGAAIGATIGLVLDLTAANDNLSDSLERVAQISADSPGDITARTEALESLRKETEALKGDPGFWGFMDTAVKQVMDSMSEGATEGEEKIAQEEAALQSMKETLSALANVGKLGAVVDYTENLGKLEEVATSIQPVLDHMGLSIEAASGLFQIDRGKFLADFSAARREMESMEGRSKAVGQAVSDLDNDLLSAADSASALAASLDTLITPFLDLVASRDAFTTGLRGLDDALSDTNNSLKGNTEGAIQNRAAVSALVVDYKDMIEAAAANGAGSVQMARMIEKGREQIIQAGLDAGLSGQQLRGFLEQAGLTPKFINTVFRALGIDKAEDDARNLADAYNRLPKEVRTEIKEKGIPETDKGLQALKRRFDLTPKQLQIVASLRDNASVKLDGVKAKVRETDKLRAHPEIDIDSGAFFSKARIVDAKFAELEKKTGKAEVDADITPASEKLGLAEDELKRWDSSKGTATLDAADHASPVISDAMSDLIRFDNYTATATITTFHRDVSGSEPQGKVAEGGLIIGPGGPTSDLAGLYALSNEEFVARAKAVKHYGPDFFYALNDMRADRSTLRRAIGMSEGGIPGMAGGGRPGDKLTRADVFLKTLRDPTLMLKDIARALHEMRDEARDVVIAERELRREREQEKDLARRVTEAEKGKGGASKALLEDQKRQSKELAQAEKALSKQREELSNATSKLKQQEQELLQQAQAISDAVTAQGAIFGGSGTSVTAGGILSKLRHAAQDARQFRDDISTLRARGVDETLIQQLLEQGSTPEGVQAVHSLAQASKHQLAQINRQQGRLERIGAQVATVGVAGGRGGGNVVVNINGPIKTTDVDRLAKLLPAHIRKALRIAKQP